MCGTTGVGGTSPDALLATCVKYPAAVPKPAPPKTTSQSYSGTMPNFIENRKHDSRWIIAPRFQKIAGVSTAQRSAPMVAWSSAL